VATCWSCAVRTDTEAMVGDRIDDAPALASHVAIAMSVGGSHAALECADVMLILADTGASASSSPTLCGC